MRAVVNCVCVCVLVSFGVSHHDVWLVIIAFLHSYSISIVGSVSVLVMGRVALEMSDSILSFIGW